MNILDGRYVGELSPEEVIEQFKYRILIHETWAGRVVQNPSQYPPANYGDYEYHLWAINGYCEGIRHIQNRPDKCTLSEAISTIIKAILKLIGR